MATQRDIQEDNVLMIGEELLKCLTKNDIRMRIVKYVG